MRNKFLTKILGATLGLAMAIGVGAGVASFSNKPTNEVKAAAGDAGSGSWGPITSASDINTNDDFLLGWNYNGTHYYSMGTTTSSGLNTTATVESAKVIRFENATNGYYIKHTSSSYINNTSSTNISLGNASSIWVVGADLLIRNTSNGNRFLGAASASSTARLKAYAEGNEGSYPNVHVYKRLLNQTLSSSPVSGEAYTDQTITVSSTATTTVTWSIVNADTTALGAAVTSGGVVSVTGEGTVKVKAVANGYVDATIVLTFVAKPAGTFVVSFDLNAESDITTPASIDNQIVDEDDYAVEPSPAPTRESTGDYNYTFVGWFDDQNADPNNDDAFDFEHTAIVGDLTLYAIWSESAKPASQKIEERLATRSALTYNYTEATKDVLTRTTTGVANEDQTYPAWSNKTATSTAVYAGCSSGDKDSIQLRSKNNNSGVVTTASGGSAKKITVVWQGDTLNGRTLNVYGKNTAYTNATELYDAETQGTLLGTIVKGTSTSLTFATAYPFVGFRSNDGAMYLSSVTIQWGEPEYSFTNVKAKFGGYVTKALWDELNAESPIQGYGVMISTTDVDPVGYIRDKHFKSEYATAIELAEGNIDNAIGLVCNGTKILNFAKSGTPYLHEAANEANYTEDTYAWNLVQSINSDHLTRTYVAAAYIRTNAGLVFLQEESVSVQEIAERMVISGEYDESPLYGSLNYLANL